MRFQIDHDLHVHTRLSLCSRDPGQTPAAIIEDAKAGGLKLACLTDHYWDSAVPCNSVVNPWYEKQNFDHIAESKPIPEAEDFTLLFGCEADLDIDNKLALPPSRYDDFDFIVISTTHFHHLIARGHWAEHSNAELARLWVTRMEALLSMDLPFYKIGVAHPACALMNCKSRTDYLETLDLIPEQDMRRVFTKAAEVGIGIELNYGDVKIVDDEDYRVMRMFKIAKECGCKFYFGTDAHGRRPYADYMPAFERAIDVLGLKESDKFVIGENSKNS